jgi:ABC-type lipoprotein release transport system permease subunit
LVLLASYRSLSSGIIAYTGQEGIDLWVAPAGTHNLIRSSSVLPRSLVEEVAALEGVRETGALVRGFVTATREEEWGERGLTLLLMCFSTPDGLGGPPSLLSGRPPRGDAEVALDRAAAFRLGVEEGDAILLNGRPMEVVALTAGTNLIATQFVFLDVDAAPTLTGYADQISFLPVGLIPGADAAAVRRQVEDRWPDLEVHDRETFIDNNLQEVVAGFRPMQLMVSAVGLVAAAVLVSLLVQSVVEDRKQDIAVLLALGADSGRVAASVIVHVLGLVVAGTLAGAALTELLRWATDRFAPTLELSTRLTDLVSVVLVFVVVGILAAVIPLLRLRRIDPVEAFRP